MLIKLEWLGYGTVKKVWPYVKPFLSDTGTLRTDGRTDRFAISVSRVSMLTRDKNSRVREFTCYSHRDLKIWVRGHSRSLKSVPFKSLGTVSYSPSIVTMAVSVAVCEIFSVKEWCDLESRVRVRSRSLEMAPFDRSHTSFYSPSIVTMAISCIVCEI